MSSQEFQGGRVCPLFCDKRLFLRNEIFLGNSTLGRGGLSGSSAWPDAV